MKVFDSAEVLVINSCKFCSVLFCPVFPCLSRAESSVKNRNLKRRRPMSIASTTFAGSRSFISSIIALLIMALIAPSMPACAQTYQQRQAQAEEQRREAE